MRTRSSLFLLSFLYAAGVTYAQDAPPVRTASDPAATAEVQQWLSDYAAAVNNRNVAGVAKLFTEDAVLIDVDGNATRGVDTIGELFASGFAEASNYVLEASLESVRRLTSDVVQLEGTSKLIAANEPSIASRFNVLLVRKDGGWQCAEIRDLPAPVADIAPYEQLRELEWMIGDWVDENADATVNSKVRWGENRSYILRASTAQVGDEKASSSLMILAWDPRTSQLRSWLFSSEGGLGEAVWTRSADNQWVIKAAGTLRDGSATSATQIVTLLNKDAVKTSSLDRIIGGEVAPDIEEVLMVRKPPAPSPPSGP